MSKRVILVTALVGIAIGVFVIQPLVISLHMYDTQGDEGNWWDYLSVTYGQIVTFQDVDQIVFNLLFGLLGIFLALMFAVRKKIFHFTTKREALMAVKELLAEGENQQVEFKSTLRWDLRQFKPNKSLEEVVAKNITGFMNTGGGNLFIGVDDGGQPLGLMEDYRSLKKPCRDGFEQYVMQLISTKLGVQYCALVNVTFYQLNDKDICHLAIKASGTPVYLHKGDRSHFYIRTGNGTRELDIPQVLNYIEEHF